MLIHLRMTVTVRRACIRSMPVSVMHARMRSATLHPAHLQPRAHANLREARLCGHQGAIAIVLQQTEGIPLRRDPRAAPAELVIHCACLISTSEPVTSPKPACNGLIPRDSRELPPLLAAGLVAARYCPLQERLSTDVSEGLRQTRCTLYLTFSLQYEG